MSVFCTVSFGTCGSVAASFSEDSAELPTPSLPCHIDSHRNGQLQNCVLLQNLRHEHSSELCAGLQAVHPNTPLRRPATCT